MQQHYQIMRKTQALWAFLLLPFINITALFLADPIYENITHIAYAKQHLLFVLIWAGSCAYYLWCCSDMLIQRLPFSHSKLRICLIVSCLFMIISVCIPYHTANSPLSKLHVRIAMLATIAYILLLLYILVKLYELYPQSGSKLLFRYVMIIALLLNLFLIIGSVSALMEVLFVIAMGIFHYHIRKVLPPE